MIGRLAQHANLARQYRGWNKLERDAAHLLTETRHHACCYGQRRFRRYVAPRWPGAPGGKHQVAAHIVDQLNQCLLDCRAVVSDQALVCLQR